MNHVISQKSNQSDTQDNKLTNSYVSIVTIFFQTIPRKITYHSKLIISSYPIQIFFWKNKETNFQVENRETKSLYLSPALARGRYRLSSTQRWGGLSPTFFRRRQDDLHTLYLYLRKHQRSNRRPCRRRQLPPSTCEVEDEEEDEWAVGRDTPDWDCASVRPR